MGLDSFWVDENNNAASVEGNLKICGGMFSGNGNTSFRGKVYNHLVEQITGVSLYQEEISAAIVKDMAGKLTQEFEKNPQAPFGEFFMGEEWSDLVKMFQLHAEAGHKLVGWW